MAGTVVDLTLQTIRDLLVDEVKFLCGVGSQVKDVQFELQRMQSFLEDVDRRKYEDPKVHNFFREIKNLSHRIEDVVEEYAAEVIEEYGQRNILNRLACIICECMNVHEVGSQISAIKTDLSNLISSMEVYGVKTALERGESHRQRETENLLRRTKASKFEEPFFGRREGIETLKTMLLSHETKHRIVSIYGMGGLGKSTLAKEMFHHEEIRLKFDSFAWVFVSQDCRPKIVFQDLLKQLLPEKDMRECDLVEEVNKVVEEKKCLVVLDDIWKNTDWNLLRPAFQTAGTKSKVLITTRKESVANVGFPYHPGLLSEDEGWELLYHKASRIRDPKDLSSDPKFLENLGREMVRKCGYLPLTISVVGGLLSKKNSLDAWQTANKDIQLYLSRSSGSEGDEDVKKVKQVLTLSYDDLPYHLKPCFLHLSSFPEDATINAEQLYLLWIGEGLVSSKDQQKEETLMDVAELYLEELANRSMVQVQVDEILAPEKFESCRLHDLLRELILAKSVEEEFLNFIDFRGGNLPLVLRPSQRLAVYTDQIPDNVSFKECIQQHRSFLLQVPRFKSPSISPDIVTDFKKSKFLRVLKFENVEFAGKTFPEELGNLIYLKLLGFNGCYLEELPSCIGNLPFLQILDFRLGYFHIPCKIPNVLWRNKRLRHLYLPEYYDVTEGKLVFSGLDELEILDGFNSKFSKFSDLSTLKRLRRLRATVYGSENLPKFIDCINDHGKHLETMVELVDPYISLDNYSSGGEMLLRKVLESRRISDLKIEAFCSEVKLPNYEQGFLSNLTQLHLVGNVILEDPMVTLEKLPKLRKLHIGFSYLGKDNSNLGKTKEITCHAGGFLELRYFELVFLDLKKWTVEKGAMPNLLLLRFFECKKLEMIPEGLTFITTLRILDVGAMPQEFINRVLQGGDDFNKVRHVKFIDTRHPLEPRVGRR